MTFIVSERCEELISFITMAPTNYFVSPPLLHGICSLHAVKPCFRTATVNFRLILPCQDFGNGFHFLHSCHCLLACGSPTRTLAHRRLPSISSTDSSAMPRLRHRMHSRRGRSRGGFNHSQASTSSIIDSPDSSTEFPISLTNPAHSYLNTRSGKGWRNNVIHIVDLPLAPLSDPHSTQFRFRSSLYMPIITATIIISFKEESGTKDTLSCHGNKQNKAESSSQRINSKQQGETSKTLHGKDKAEDTGKWKMDVAGTEIAPIVQGWGTY